MRIAIISDVHANLEALTKALESIDRENAEQVVCLGDVVGYGADPNECLDLVRTRCSIVLRGNHDAAIVDDAELESFTPHARTAALWTRRALTPTNVKYLSGLPFSAILDGALLVHSSPCRPQDWEYILSRWDAAFAFRCFSEQVCFVGHSHVPFLYPEKGAETEFQRGVRFVINVGSVGQPRDGNSNLSYGMFDTSKWTYRNHRCTYDIATAAEKIRSAGLPSRLAERLFAGL